MISKLCEVRRNKGVTLQQVCDAIGLNTGNLSRIENGIQHPKPDTAKRLASYYGVSLDVIYGYEPK